MRRRLARLGPGARAALALAAIIGPEFEVDALASAGAGDPLELLQALDDAAEAGIVARAGPPGRHAFAHALVAKTIVSALPAARRAQLHLQVAEHLAERHRTGTGVQAGEVARHLRAAGPLAAAEQLAEWDLAAAREATAALAYAEAAHTTRPPWRRGRYRITSVGTIFSPWATRKTGPGGAPRPARRSPRRRRSPAQATT